MSRVPTFIGRKDVVNSVENMDIKSYKEIQDSLGDKHMESLIRLGRLARRNVGVKKIGGASRA